MCLYVLFILWLYFLILLHERILSIVFVIFFPMFYFLSFQIHIILRFKNFLKLFSLLITTMVKTHVYISICELFFYGKKSRFKRSLIWFNYFNFFNAHIFSLVVIDLKSGCMKHFKNFIFMLLLLQLCIYIYIYLY